MWEVRGVYRVFVWKPEEKSPFGSPKIMGGKKYEDRSSGIGMGLHGLGLSGSGY
jgi:hypothetical protein